MQDTYKQMSRIDEIRERYENATRALTWRDVSEVDLSLGDIPYLLDEVARLQDENEALRRERDAAARDIYSLAAGHSCHCCQNNNDCDDIEDSAITGCDEFEWRGVAPESEG